MGIDFAYEFSNRVHLGNEVTLISMYNIMKYTESIIYNQVTCSSCAMVI